MYIQHLFQFGCFALASTPQQQEPHTHTQKKIVVTALSQVVGVDSIIIITMRNPTQRTLLLVKVLCFKAFFGFLFAFIVAAVHIIS